MSLKFKANRIGDLAIFIFMATFFLAVVSMFFEIKFLGLFIFFLMIAFIGLRDKYLEIRIKEIDESFKKDE